MSHPSTLVIDKKKYVVLEQRQYEELLKKAAAKHTIARKVSLSEGKKLAHQLIDKWHNEK